MRYSYFSFLHTKNTVDLLNIRRIHNKKIFNRLENLDCLIFIYIFYDIKITFLNVKNGISFHNLYQVESKTNTKYIKELFYYFVFNLIYRSYISFLFQILCFFYFLLFSSLLDIFVSYLLCNKLNYAHSVSQATKKSISILINFFTFTFLLNVIIF